MSRFTRIRNNTIQRQPVDLVFHAGEKNTGTFPKSRDTFRVEGHYKQRFDAKHSTPPSSVTIWFPVTNLSKIAQVFKEFRNSGGVPLARISTDWTQWETGSAQEEFEIFEPASQQWMKVEETAFDAFVERQRLVGKDTLRLFFMLPEFMEEGIYALCQIETRGVESSIPSILNTLVMWYNAGKLQVPFKLVLSKNTGKGVKKTGENETHIYPVLSLVPDTTEQAQKAIATTVQKFLSLAVAPSILQQHAIQTQERPALTAGSEASDYSETPESLGTHVVVETPPSEQGMRPTQPIIPGHIEKLSGNALRKEVKKVCEGTPLMQEFVKVQSNDGELRKLYARATNAQHEEPPAPEVIEAEHTEDITPDQAMAFITQYGNSAQREDASINKNDPERFWQVYDDVKAQHPQADMFGTRTETAQEQ